MPTYLVILAIGGMIVSLLTFLIAFFHPGLDYRISGDVPSRLDSAEFLRLAALLSDSEPHTDTCVEVLTNGPSFYESELAAIRNARTYVCLEAYIFQKGKVASRFIEALADRA